MTRLSPQLRSTAIISLIFALNAIAFAQFTFLPVVAYQSGGSGGGAIVAVDLNADGVVDLVVTDGPELIGVLQGKGDGTFRPPVSYSTNGIISTNIAVADVNADGKPDVLVSGIHINSNYVGAVEVFLGLGDGSFQSPVVYDSGGSSPYSVATGDFNGDGKLDIVVADCSPMTASPCGLFGVLLGNGDGTFEPVVTHNSGGFGAWALTVADLNNDQKADIVIANLCTNAICTNSSNGVIAVLLGKGDGTFKSPVTYDSGGRTLVPAIADVNGDGKSDILVVNGQGKQGLGVLLGNGDGSFRPVVTYDVGQKYVSSLAIADFDNDSKPDVAISVCNSGQYTCGANASVAVMRGNGDGTFQKPIIYSSGGWNAVGLAVADVNHDGLADIEVANCAPLGGSCDGTSPGAIGILVNNTASRTPTTTILESSTNPSSVGQSVTFTATVTSSAGPPPNGESITFYNGSSALGTGTLNSGLAFLSTSALAAGTHIITAKYPGDSNFAASDSSTLKQTVNSTTKSPTSTSLATSLNPSTYGQKVTFTAAVTNNGGSTPTGKVSFTWGTYTIGTATLNSSGVATLTKSNLNVQTFPLTAVYKGDTNNLGSTSAVLNQVVNQASSTATLTSSQNPSTAGQAVTFTAKITSSTVRPTGAVTFTAGNAVLGTVQLTNGKATLTTSSLSARSTVVKVVYTGNSDIKGSSASVTQVVQ